MEQLYTRRCRVLHLFAGAGGGLLCDLILGHIPVCAVEIDPYCQRVLIQRQADGILPWFPIWDDVTTFDGIPWRGHADVVSGGFPCQDLSTAGKRTGITGARSGLWTEFARLIGEIRPRYAFIENVPGLAVRGLDRVLADLAALGMDARWCCLGADDVGAPHIRKRLWILAYASGDQLRHQPGRSGGQSRQDPSFAGDNGAAGDVADARCQRLEAGRASDQPAATGSVQHVQPECGGQDVGHATGLRCDGLATKPRGIDTSAEEGGMQQLAGASCWSAQSDVDSLADGLAAGLGGPWTTEPADVPRVASGVPDRIARLKALGNGWCPQTAVLAWRILNSTVEKQGETHASAGSLD